MSGSGCGVFFLGPAIVYLVDNFGWRGAMLVCSGLSMNFCFFGAFIYEKKRKSTSLEKSNDVSQIESQESKKQISEVQKSNENQEIDQVIKNNESNSTDPNKNLHVIDHTHGYCKNSPFLFIKKIIYKIYNAVMQLYTKTEHKTPQEKEVITTVKYSFSFRCLQISCFLCILTTTTLFAILQDWVLWIDLSDYFSYGLSAVGAGDLIGRLAAGIIPKKFSPVLVFSLIQVLLGITIGLAALSVNYIHLIISLTIVGISFGLYSVVFALVPSKMGSGSALNWILGQLLLAQGFGALAGPPLAGLIVDQTKQYTEVLVICTIAPIIASVLNLFPYILTWKSQSQTSEVTQV